MKKRFCKKFIIYILIGVIASSSVMMSYGNARTVKAVAIVDDIAIILAICAAFGISINIWEIYQDKWKDYKWGEPLDSPADLKPGTDAWNGLNDLLNDGMSTKVLERAQELGLADSNGDPTGNYDNGDNDPENWKWETVKECFKKYGLKGAMMSAVMCGTMSQIVSDKNNSVVTDVSSLSNFAKLNCNERRPNYASFVDITDNITYCVTYPSTTYIYHDTPTTYKFYSIEFSNCFMYKVLEDGSFFNNSTVGFSGSHALKYKFDSIIASTVIWSSLDALEKWLVSKGLEPDNYDISSSLNTDSNGKYEPLGQPITDSPNIPSNQDIMDYLNNLNNSNNNDEKQSIIDEFIDKITNVNPDPDPTPDPDPDPTPDPDPPVDISPENPNKIDPSESGGNLVADLRLVFPFCIPFDLVDCFNLFNKEPETPCIEVPFNIDILDFHYTFIIDLKDFNGVAMVCRSMFLILFMVGLILSTRNLIRG